MPGQGLNLGQSGSPQRIPMRDRKQDKERLLTDDNRKAALWMVDAWANLAERKDEEATAAYALARERADQLDAMTRARNHCKRQTADVGSRLLGLRTWLRDTHPDVYAAIPEKL